MRRLSLIFVLLAPFLIAPTCDGKARAKKLIEMGWDEPDPAFMRAHLAQLEATPFDGCVYHLPYPSLAGEANQPINWAWAIWGSRRFREDELRSSVQDLEATPFRRFRSNFLRMNVTPGNLDWFDDHAAVMSNLELGASIARRGGSAGVMLDTEQYQSHLFEYASQRDATKRSYREYAEQARRRGVEAMQALERGYPGLTVFLTMSVTYPYLVWMGDRKPIEQQPYGLLVPFVDGMISAASSSARIVDGMEASYPVRDPAVLDRYYEAQTRGVLPWVSDSTRYRRVVSRAFGIWLDFDAPKHTWHLGDPDQNYRPPAALQRVLRRALQLSDEFVWVYGQTPRWWSAEGRKNLPTAFDRALRQARNRPRN